MLEKELIDYLLSVVAITSVVKRRIVPGLLEIDAVLPAISIVLTANERERTLGGCDIKTDKLEVSVWNSDAVKVPYSDSVDLAKIVSNNLNNKSRFLATVKVLGCFLQDEKDTLDEQARAKGRLQIYKIIYT